MAPCKPIEESSKSALSSEAQGTQGTTSALSCNDERANCSVQMQTCGDQAQECNVSSAEEDVTNGSNTCEGTSEKNSQENSESNVCDEHTIAQDPQEDCDTTQEFVEIDDDELENWISVDITCTEIDQFLELDFDCNGEGILSVY